MFKNYLTVAIRGLLRSKLHSFLNIAGLAIGIGVFTIAGLYAKYELSYDRYNTNADRTYRVITHMKMGTNEYALPMAAAPLADALRQLPEVECVARLSRPSNVNARSVVVRSARGSFAADNFFYADEGFFKVFTVKLLAGNPSMALVSPHSIVISLSAANKLFPDAIGALGKTLDVSEGDETHDYVITGIMADMPPNSHFRADYLASLVTNTMPGPPIMNWSAPACLTYFVLKPNTAVKPVESQFPGIIEQNVGKRFLPMLSYSVQKLTDIHLHSHLLLEMEPNGSVSTLIIFLSVGLLVLLIAVINFITLSTARYSDRAREVGIRKVVGSNRKKLVAQFIGEAIILTIVSMVIAVALVELALPQFNSMTGKSISLSMMDIGVVFVGSLIVGFVSGAYPAFFLSSFGPDAILRKNYALKPNGLPFRKDLVLLQFVLAVGTIICGFVIWNQLNYVRTRDLGFNKNHVLVISMLQQEVASKYPLLKEEFKRVPGVVGVSGASLLLANLDNRFPLLTANGPLFETRLLFVDSDFVKVMGVKVLSGVFTSPAAFSDTTTGILVNQVAAKKLLAMHSFDSPLASITKMGETPWTRVMGVVSDFNYRPLYYPVDPIIIVPSAGSTRYMYVKFDSGKSQEVLAALEKIWKAIVPQYPMDVHYLDQELSVQYGSDDKLADFVYISAFLAVLISMMGLFGLVNYSVEKRVKEIGVRKAVGATASDIVRLLMRDFAKPVLAANIIAWPVAYYFADRWLQNFAFRTEINVWPFITAGVIAFSLAMATVGSLALKSADANPVEALRYE